MNLLISLFLLILIRAEGTPSQIDSMQRAKMAELYFADDKEGVLKACRDLISFHMENGNEKLLFNAYATLFDRLEMWGKFDEAVAVLEEMSSEAQQRKSALGSAVSEFCFGQFYLGNRHPQEAEPHYRRAFQELQLLGENVRALRAGFNLQAIAMNLNTPEAGLSINDSTAVLLQRIEEKAGRQSIENRLKQNRYRLVLLLRTGRTQEAAALKDSLLHYHARLNDSSQDEIVLTAIAQLEQQTGQKDMAYSRLDTLIKQNLQNGNYLKAARFRLTLADFQRNNGDLEQAVDSYRTYAAESDSAQIQRTNEQLNALAKKYELNELRLENQAFRQQVVSLSLVVVLLIILTFVIFMYAQVLRRRNRALYQASMKRILAEEQSEQSLIETYPDQQSPEEKIYASFLSLMHDEKIFKDPDLSRDIICSRLGTNRTYLSQSIEKCSGQSVMSLVNHFRLRWAAEALSGDNIISVISIGEEAGFGSRSTFYRKFQEEYGISPSAYRSAAFQQLQ